MTDKIELILKHANYFKEAAKLHLKWKVEYLQKKLTYLLGASILITWINDEAYDDDRYYAVQNEVVATFKMGNTEYKLSINENIVDFPESIYDSISLKYADFEALVLAIIESILEYNSCEDSNKDFIKDTPDDDNSD